LAQQGQIAEATYHAKAAVEGDPMLAPARLLFAELLLASGDLQGSIREFEEGIRLKPDSPRAHYELGLALTRAGSRAQAIEHLRVAAQGPDPEARAAALQLLRSFGQ
jgi:tetratricopeptide (TPR) repeat protein